MFSFQSIITTLTVTLVVAAGAQAEKHTITFKNNCGRGTPKLIQAGNTLHSGGGSYTHNGALMSAIAYLQTGDRDQFEEPSFTWSRLEHGRGCNGVGNRCGSASCCPNGAFCKPDDYQAQRQCQVNDVNLVVTFC
ncbi:unnamed protein product [Rhizoctonia solani]|uniref:Uncharacterized protein n=1 Tax=Rhizoctonia solani TaxID=456999 RepID=A0A8H3H2W5_9AGAM|nr:unnamed protein product [Rhizoctonia solani]